VLDPLKPVSCRQRALLGVFEAPMLPGISFIMSRFYRRGELMLRLAINLAVAALVGSFVGLLAAGLVAIPSIGKLRQWQNSASTPSRWRSRRSLLCRGPRHHPRRLHRPLLHGQRAVPGDLPFASPA